MATPTEQLKELKKIAQIRFDKERHQLTAINEEMARLEAEKKAVRKQITDITGGQETSPASLMNAYAYLDALTRKAERLDAERREAHERTEAQREKIKTALASKIRVDGMEEG
ncbi:hypothetical protein [Hyphococcus sp.]|jgi:uncharacterized protein (UPF0335 family)|uniref:hypothetical protein n=1 Tax=Hyphococcus sp. TaxID=2038636 RepID=UPI003D0CE20F